MLSLRIVSSFVICLSILLSHCAGAAETDESIVKFGPFGNVHIYGEHRGDASAAPATQNVVLFISGDGGWNLGVVDMARELASTGALVAGIDVVHYLSAQRKLPARCAYPAAHFEALSQYLQKKFNFKTYRPPVLVGYSSGATLVYLILAQSPDNTFRGGISLGFCPDLNLVKPPCRGSGDFTWRADAKHRGTFFMDPAKRLAAPWVALQGTIDQVCFAGKTRHFVSQVGGGKIVILPKVGHGYSVQKNWMPQFKAAYSQMVAPPARSSTAVGANPSAASPEVLKDLPLVALPTHTSGELMAIIMSGDGGWAGIDKSLGEALNHVGIPTVGLNTLQYLWTRKTPERAAHDIARIGRAYTARWHRKKILLVGYSLGADILPFIVNRLPADIRNRLAETVAISPGRNVDFQFHVTDWLTSKPRETSMEILPEIEKLARTNLLCIYGSDEAKSSVCPNLDTSAFSVVQMKGGHHLGGDYAKLAQLVLRHSR